MHSPEEYAAKYAESINQPESFWSRLAENFHWYKRWHTLTSGSLEETNVKWFEGGTTNICYNALDRHLPRRQNDTAIFWEPNAPEDEARAISYGALFELVNDLAAYMQRLGLQPGDRVCLYMPMLPESVAAMLACARLGLVHMAVFAGFSAQSLKDRIVDSGCKLLIVADELKRGDKRLNLKTIADEALEGDSPVTSVLVYRNTGAAISMKPDRDFYWDEAVRPAQGTVPCYEAEAEHPLYILHTSGSTGKPKGLLHTTAGYMVWTAFTFGATFAYKQGEVYWCTADIGWVTGHSYITYGPLLCGATQVMHEGLPGWPTPDRIWQIVEKYKVNILYTAPTAIRSLMAAGNEWVSPYAMKSLRVLGSVGEPINEEAWKWYNEHVGHNNAFIVDTWWQTETGGIMISPLPNTVTPRPGYAMHPLPGVLPELMDEQGKPVPPGEGRGNLVIARPWPGMARTIWGDHERYRQTYFTAYPGYYNTGDGAMREKNGEIRVTGRVDDVINVSGHRIGTGEVEAAINTHPQVVESAVVGFPHEVKGQALYAYVICPENTVIESELISQIKELVTKRIGAIARPDKVQIVEALPKTRSGKIIRRILRKIAEGETENLGDATTLLDPSVIPAIIAGRNSA